MADLQNNRGERWVTPGLVTGHTHTHTHAREGPVALRSALIGCFLGLVSVIDVPRYPQGFVFASAAVFVLLKSTCRLSEEFVGQ